MLAVFMLKAEWKIDWVLGRGPLGESGQRKGTGRCFITTGKTLALENSGKLPCSRMRNLGHLCPKLRGTGRCGRGEVLVHCPAIWVSCVPEWNGFCGGGCKGSLWHRGEGTGSCKSFREHTER